MVSYIAHCVIFIFESFYHKSVAKIANSTNSYETAHTELHLHCLQCGLLSAVVVKLLRNQIENICKKLFD